MTNRKWKYTAFVWILCILLILHSSIAFCIVQDKSDEKKEVPGVRKIKDFVIYKDTMFFSAFPSIDKTKDGEILLAFRRSPDRKVMMGYKGRYHVDPNSYLMMLRSSDGESWEKVPKLMFAHPFGGSQDPCLLSLRDGTILSTSYCWTFIQPEGIVKLKQPFSTTSDGGIFFGGFFIRSVDNGKTWGEPIYPPSISPYFNAIGQNLPAYNRGKLCEAKNGQLFWVAANADLTQKVSTYLFVSDDKGLSWKYSCPVATDERVSFNETSLFETPKGDLVAFLRTANLDDHACIARSTDGGKSFAQWEDMGFQGHPLHALKLHDGRVLLSYGYRHEPFGIRARILNPECTDYKTAPEIILRDDGGNQDLGYPWSVQLDENRVLVVYYFNYANDTRFIGGTILQINDNWK